MFLAKMVYKKCEYAVLEVTSHGLDQERVSGIDFDLSVLTNISHEHLDYHKTLLNYIEVKVKLLNNSKKIVINKDDSSYKKVINLLRGDVKIVNYSQKSLKRSIRSVVVKKFPLDYNKMNAIAAIKVAQLLGIGSKDIKKALSTFPGIIGRFEKIKNDIGTNIYIDFAHTPNALKNLLTNLRKRNGDGKLISVFGCAGERDWKKRTMMEKNSTKIQIL